MAHNPIVGCLLGTAVGDAIPEVRSMRLRSNRFVVLMSFLLFAGCGERGEVSLRSTSPDGKYQVYLVEFTVFIDRNFKVRLTELATRKTRTLFSSPDEGRPVGTERVVWSKDARRFVLLGRQFFTKEEAHLPTGEQLYLMYDLSTGELWCNARQQSQYPAFGAKELAEVEWNERIEPPPPSDSGQPADPLIEEEPKCMTP
jgi:hypothetical protein